MATMFNNINCFDYNGVAINKLDCQIQLATSGHFQGLARAFFLCLVSSQTEAVSLAQADASMEPPKYRPFDGLLNNAPASFRRGILIQFKPGPAARAQSRLLL